MLALLCTEAARLCFPGTSPPQGSAGLWELGSGGGERQEPGQLPSQMLRATWLTPQGPFPPNSRETVYRAQGPASCGGGAGSPGEPRLWGRRDGRAFVVGNTCEVCEGCYTRESGRSRTSWRQREERAACPRDRGPPECAGLPSVPFSPSLVLPPVGPRAQLHTPGLAPRQPGPGAPGSTTRQEGSSPTLGVHPRKCSGVARPPSRSSGGPVWSGPHPVARGRSVSRRGGLDGGLDGPKQHVPPGRAHMLSGDGSPCAAHVRGPAGKARARVGARPLEGNPEYFTLLRFMGCSRSKQSQMFIFPGVNYDFNRQNYSPRSHRAVKAISNHTAGNRNLSLSLPGHPAPTPAPGAPSPPCTQTRPALPRPLTSRNLEPCRRGQRPRAVLELHVSGGQGLGFKGGTGRWAPWIGSSCLCSLHRSSCTGVGPAGRTRNPRQGWGWGSKPIGGG